MFYTFMQNNSGGYFVEDDNAGICEIVIIEDLTPGKAWEKLMRIGEDVVNFESWCSCCGPRWSELYGSAGFEEPMIYGTPVKEVVQDVFSRRSFVHYIGGELEEIVFKPKK